MAKLLTHPRGLKLPLKTRKKIEAEGYILIAEDEIGSVRVIEPLPDFDIGGDSEWLIRTLLQLVMADDGYSGTKGKFSARLLKRLEARFAVKTEADKPALQVVDKAS